jgi:YidC/Oxa1 family membrane protein insertase
MKFFKLINNFFFYTFINKKFSFYSESIFYQKNYVDFINEITNKFKKDKVYYFSSDEIDVIKHNNKVVNVYIGRGFVRVLFFIFVKSKYFFMTLTDLNNHELKKSTFVENYIYIFHSTISLFRGYTKSAFDHYDTFFSTGPTCTKELKKIIENRLLKKKTIQEVGYFLFDRLHNQIQSHFKNNYVLIAPSWNVNSENFFELDCLNLIIYLLNKNYDVILRPHPEHFKRNKEHLNLIKKRTASYQNFKFDFEPDNIRSISDSNILITDYSGIAIEYTLINEKPVIYFDKYPKKHNEKFEEFYKAKILIEDEIKLLFGKSFQKENLNNLDKEINFLKEDFKLKIENLRKYRKNNFSNFRESTKIAVSKLF